MLWEQKIALIYFCRFSTTYAFRGRKVVDSTPTHYYGAQEKKKKSSLQADTEFPPCKVLQAVYSYQRKVLIIRIKTNKVLETLSWNGLHFETAFVMCYWIFCFYKSQNQTFKS